MDTSGKDGTIKHVMSNVNPLGCRAEAFKVPTEEELVHDFLWRVHKITPARGMMTIFNRSHYEDVIVVRVHDLVPKSVWEARYDQIVDFERALADTGTLMWFRNLAVAEATVDALAAHRDEWNDVLRVLAQAKLAELRTMRTAAKSAT
jgi:polyphosphate kinase 2 (PPK2 family)